MMAGIITLAYCFAKKHRKTECIPRCIVELRGSRNFSFSTIRLFIAYKGVEMYIAFARANLYGHLRHCQQITHTYHFLYISHELCERAFFNLIDIYIKQNFIVNGAL
jgi:hypothetical protein